MTAAAATIDDPADLDAEVAASVAADKPSLDEMLAWVDRYETTYVDAALLFHQIHGDYGAAPVRLIAVVRQLRRFLARCADCPDDIATVFRAVEHRKKWRRG